MYLSRLFINYSLRFLHASTQCQKEDFKCFSFSMKVFLLFFESKFELNMFLNYHMELDNPQGKMVVR